MREKTKVKRMFSLDAGSFGYEMGMMTCGKNLEERRRVFTPFSPDTGRDGY